MKDHLSRDANVFCFYGDQWAPDKTAAEETLKGYYGEQNQDKLKLYPLPHNKHEIMIFLNQQKDKEGNRYLKNIARIVNDHDDHVQRLNDMFYIIIFL
mgnify:CR=1 FL=1